MLSYDDILLNEIFELFNKMQILLLKSIRRYNPNFSFLVFFFAITKLLRIYIFPLLTTKYLNCELNFLNYFLSKTSITFDVLIVDMNKFKINSTNLWRGEQIIRGVETKCVNKCNYVIIIFISFLFLCYYFEHRINNKSFLNVIFKYVNECIIFTTI